MSAHGLHKHSTVYILNTLASYNMFIIFNYIKCIKESSMVLCLLCLREISVTMLYFNIGMSGFPDMYTRGLRVYISGKPRVHMSQLLCAMAPPTSKY